MKFFLLSDDAAVVRDAAELGLVDGVITSRVGAARAGVDYLSHVLGICECVEGPVSVEVSSMDRRGMVREAESLLEVAGNVMVRVPAVQAGLKSCRDLSRRGHRVQVTPCYQPMQAVAAAKAGAVMAGVALGLEETRRHKGAPSTSSGQARGQGDRVGSGAGRGGEEDGAHGGAVGNEGDVDRATSGFRVLEKVRRMYCRYGFATEILVVGMKRPEELVEAAMMGAEAAVVTPGLLEQMVAGQGDKAGFVASAMRCLAARGELGDVEG